MSASNEFSQILHIWECLLSLSFLIIFSGYRILGWEPFSFITLNMSSHCLLACMDSDDDLLMAICDVTSWGSIWLYPTWSLLNFWAVYINFFFSSTLRSFLPLGLKIFFLSVSFFPLLLELLYAGAGMFEDVLPVCEVLFISFHPFHLFVHCTE